MMPCGVERPTATTLGEGVTLMSKKRLTQSHTCDVSPFRSRVACVRAVRCAGSDASASVLFAASVHVRQSSLRALPTNTRAPLSSQRLDSQVAAPPHRTPNEAATHERHTSSLVLDPCVVSFLFAMSELRQRKDGSSKSAAAADSSATFVDHEPDSTPLVAPAASAFAYTDDSDGADGALAAPVSESMDDDDATAAAVAGLDSANGSLLKQNLPHFLREKFEKRRDELLEKYPDMLVRGHAQARARRVDSTRVRPASATHRSLFPVSPPSQTRDITNDPGLGADDGLTRCRFDVLALFLMLGLLSLVLYTEYNINLPALFGSYVRRLLDPGPIQRAHSEHDETVGQATIDAAMRAVKERLQNAQ